MVVVEFTGWLRGDNNAGSEVNEKQTQPHNAKMNSWDRTLASALRPFPDVTSQQLSVQLGHKQRMTHHKHVHHDADNSALYTRTTALVNTDNAVLDEDALHNMYTELPGGHALD